MHNDIITGGVMFRAGDWRDTIPLWDSSPALIRFHLADFAGPMVMHCHKVHA